MCCDISAGIRSRDPTSIDVSFFTLLDSRSGQLQGGFLPSLWQGASLNSANRMGESKAINQIQIGDRVLIRYKVWSRGHGYVTKITRATRITKTSIYADDKRFSRTTGKGMAGFGHYTLVAIAEPWGRDEPAR
jgi:hypothetical protein